MSMQCHSGSFQAIIWTHDPADDITVTPSRREISHVQVERVRQHRMVADFDYAYRVTLQDPLADLGTSALLGGCGDLASRGVSHSREARLDIWRPTSRSRSLDGDRRDSAIAQSRFGSVQIAVLK
jgi:hypothetical protein